MFICIRGMWLYSQTALSICKSFKQTEDNHNVLSSCLGSGNEMVLQLDAQIHYECWTLVIKTCLTLRRFFKVLHNILVMILSSCWSSLCCLGKIFFNPVLKQIMFKSLTNKNNNNIYFFGQQLSLEHFASWIKNINTRPSSPSGWFFLMKVLVCM